MKLKYRSNLKQWMKKKISFRLHMSAIMFSTVFLGMITNFVMMNTLGITHPGLRYPLTIIFSYAWFLLLIRIYIKHILADQSALGKVLEYVDIPVDFGAAKTSPVPWCGGGGKFSGGGASGDWGASETVSEVAKESVKSSVEGGISTIFDDEVGAVVLVVGAALMVIVFGSGAYLIWHSPEILSECLIQVILVSGMRKQMKKFTESQWISHMFRTTLVPFLVVLIMSIILGSMVRKICPSANNLRDFMSC